MRFDAVFFDSGGTIWLSRKPGTVPPGLSLEELRDRRAVRLANALSGLGYPADAGQVQEALPGLEQSCPGRFGAGFTYTDLIFALGEALGLSLRSEDLLLCADAYVGPRYRSSLNPGIEEALRAIAASGRHVGLLSNTYIPGLCVDRLLRSVGLLGYFKTRIYSGDEAVSKPDPGIFRLAERRSGLAGRRVLYVGDDVVNDIQAARAVGWSAALVRSSAAGSGGAADFEFDHMSELVPFALA